MVRRSALLLGVVGLTSIAHEAAGVDWGVGANFLQAGAVHAASGDILLLTDPEDKSEIPDQPQSKPVSVAVVPGGSKPGANFSSLPVIDNGSVVAYPVDVAIAGDTAYILDEAYKSAGVVAFKRSASGKWGFWKKFLLSDQLSSCDSEGRQFSMPEAIAAGPKGELYVAMAVEYGKRCPLKPWDRCCSRVSRSGAIMKFDPEVRGGKGAFEMVVATRSFFTLPNSTEDAGFHIRALDVTAEGNIVIAGHGEFFGSSYFGHSVWVWDVSAKKTARIAGQDFGDGGKGGDGGSATKAQLNLPWGVAVSGGDIFIAEAGNLDVRKVSKGSISIEANAPRQKGPNDYTVQYPRKIHQGASPGKLLLAISGLGSDDGKLVEFDAAKGKLDTVLV